MTKHRKKFKVGKVGAAIITVTGVIVSVSAITVLNGMPEAKDSTFVPETKPVPTIELPLSETVTVQRVIDGDTFIAKGKQELNVRILGIDSCEKRGVECRGGLRATNMAAKLLPVGASVKLIQEPGVNLDMYKRALRYVQLSDGRDYGSVMVVENHTGVYKGKNDASPKYMQGLQNLDKDGRNCA